MDDSIIAILWTAGLWLSGLIGITLIYLLLDKTRRRKMTKVYDKELSCGCLLSTRDEAMIPCETDNCKFMEEMICDDSANI